MVVRTMTCFYCGGDTVDGIYIDDEALGRLQFAEGPDDIVIRIEDLADEKFNRTASRVQRCTRCGRLKNMEGSAT